MDRDAASQAQGRSRSSGGEERPQGQPPGARAGGCLGGRAGLIGVGGSSDTPRTPSVFCTCPAPAKHPSHAGIWDTRCPAHGLSENPGTPSVSPAVVDAQNPADPQRFSEAGARGEASSSTPSGVRPPPECSRGVEPETTESAFAPLWSPEALAELAALAEEVLPRRCAAPVSLEVLRARARDAWILADCRGRGLQACHVCPDFACGDNLVERLRSAPAGGEPALKE